VKRIIIKLIIIMKPVDFHKKIVVALFYLFSLSWSWLNS